MEFLKRLWAALFGNQAQDARIKEAGRLIFDANKDALIAAFRGFFSTLTYGEKSVLTSGNVEVALHRVIAGANVPTLVKSTAEILVTDAVSGFMVPRSIAPGPDGIHLLENAVVAAIKGAKL